MKKYRSDVVEIPLDQATTPNHGVVSFSGEYIAGEDTPEGLRSHKDLDHKTLFIVRASVPMKKSIYLVLEVYGGDGIKEIAGAEGEIRPLRAMHAPQFAKYYAIRIVATKDGVVVVLVDKRHDKGVLQALIKK